ncbi:MAG: type II toxin-antitoxin system PemK/MazF family toxin [Synechococcales cyanobacterium CRU_2_2]|nr:type II toxin-antitoxin system PemK/MazF family toxin [Synechococcales cyanobacterium CRU_2_2]
MYRGEIWWASLPEPTGSGPGNRRPVLIVQDDVFNQSRVQTVVVVIITSNLRLAEAPGNVMLPAQAVGLPKDSVINVSQVFTIDKTVLDDRVGRLPDSLQEEVDEGLRMVLFL